MRIQYLQAEKLLNANKQFSKLRTLNFFSDMRYIRKKRAETSRREWSGHIRHSQTHPDHQTNANTFHNATKTQTILPYRGKYKGNSK